MKDLSEPNITTYHYEYDPNGNRTLVEIKDDGLTLESTVYTYDRLNKLIRSREVTASGLYIYEYTYDENGNLTQEDRHRAYELNTNQWTNIRRYEYTKDNKLESVYSGNILLVAYTYDGDGTITSSFDRDLDLNQNLNIHDTNYINSLTHNQRQLINKVQSNDSFLYELTEYITDKNQTYTQTLMERDGTGQLSTIYTYGNQRINSESYNNLSGLYTYDGRGSVSAVIGSYGDFRASYWYDGLGNVKSQIHGYGAFGSGKKYYGYNAESYSPVTGNQNLRARQLNIRRQRFLTEDTYIGNKTDTLSINRYIYGNGNPLKYKDPSGNFIISGTALLIAGAVSLGAGVIAGVATGVTTGDWEKGLKTGLVTAGATAVGIAAGAAAVAGATALGASALVTGVVGGAVGNGVRSVARNTLGNVALGEKNSLGKIGKDLALESLTGAIGGAGGTIVRGLTSTGTKAVVQGAVSAISTGARDVAENAFFGGNKSSTDIWANMGFSFVTSAGISYLGDTLISKMNAAKANSGVQACKKAEVNNNASSSNNSVYANKGYNPKPGERTFKGYVEQNVDSNAELSLYTDSNQFSNTSKNLPIEGGAFKRFGVDEHAGISPHVHYETYRNIDPNNSNIIRGGIKDNPVRYPNAKDVKQLYDYLENGKYHK